MAFLWAVVSRLVAGLGGGVVVGLVVGSWLEVGFGVLRGPGGGAFPDSIHYSRFIRGHQGAHFFIMSFNFVKFLFLIVCSEFCNQRCRLFSAGN